MQPTIATTACRYASPDGRDRPSTVDDDRTGGGHPQRRPRKRRTARRPTRSDRTPRSAGERRVHAVGRGRARAGDRRRRGDRQRRRRGVRCTACRSPSRTRSPRPGSARPGGSPQLLDNVPHASTPRSWRRSRTRARSCSARPMCRCGQATFRRSTRCSARPTTRGTSPRARRVVGRCCGGGRVRHDELRDRHRHRRIGARAVRRSAACSATSRRSASSRHSATSTSRTAV